MDPDNPDAIETARQLQEEIHYLTERATRLGGEFARIAITHVVRTHEGESPRAIPLIPFDPSNVVHRLAKEEGFIWPDASQTT